jgi:hypothetical protein
MLMIKKETEGLASKRRPTYIRNLTLQEYSRSFRKVKEEKEFSSYQCYHCDKMGHIAKNCPARRE